MIHSKTLSICLICLFTVACNTPEQAAPVKKDAEIITSPKNIVPDKTAEEKIAKEKPAIMKTRPVMNLSIDNISIDHQAVDDNYLGTGIKTTENSNTLFETLNKNQDEPKYSLSGKLLTDEEKVENKEYLDSVDGVQIYIEGNFN